MPAPLPPEADALLALAPEEFVPKRTELARALRSQGRRDEAEAVQALRKPPPVVLAVNRAARDRPRAARGAVTGAERLAKAQLSGNRTTYDKAAADLESALDLIAEVALAHLSLAGKSPAEKTRVRVRTLLRAAASDEASREALGRGALRQEVEPQGFQMFAGMPTPKRKSRRPEAGSRRPEARSRDEARAREAREQLREARQRVREAERRVRDAERERDAADAALEELRAELRRL